MIKSDESVGILWRNKTILEFRYDTLLLIEGENLDENTISENFANNFKGDCLSAVGDYENGR